MEKNKIILGVVMALVVMLSFLFIRSEPVEVEPVNENSDEEGIVDDGDMFEGEYAEEEEEENPLNAETQHEISYAHVKPGEYSEIYISVSNLKPGEKTSATLRAQTASQDDAMEVVADERGVAHYTFTITSLGIYTAQVTSDRIVKDLTVVVN